MSEALYNAATIHCFSKGTYISCYSKFVALINTYRLGQYEPRIRGYYFSMKVENRLLQMREAAKRQRARNKAKEVALKDWPWKHLSPTRGD